MAGFRCFPDRRTVPDVVRRSQKNRHIGLLFQALPNRFRVHRAAQQAFPRRRQQPVNLQLQQRGRGHQGFVGIPSGQDFSGKAHLLRPPGRQGQHSADAQGRALRGINRPRGAEKLRRVFFAFPDDAPGPVQVIRSADFRNVAALRSQKHPPFMPGHMKTGRVSFGICGNIVGNRRVHFFSPPEASARAACSMIAHSIRFRKSSQP